ncbi:DUF881 domain-containing protein [Candidatus Berkelbacteria bacterium]|nr:DUF881 domain-containing protein [Candidatus Berkelbacteria bacterium]
MQRRLLAMSIFSGVGAISGFLIMAQRRVIPERVVNPITPYQSLVDLAADVNYRQRQILKDIAAERAHQIDLENQIKNSLPNQKDVVDELNEKEKLAGVQSMKGEGVIITLDDAKKGKPTVESIVHASDVRDVVNVAWLAGAQAVDVNGQRVVAITSIDNVSNAVVVNNTKIINPFVIKVVGNRSNLQNNLNHQKELSDLMSRSKNTGLLYHIEPSQEVEVASYPGLLSAKVTATQ